MQPNKNKYLNDRQIIVSIIKYVLIAALVILVLILGARVFLLLIPVLLGFILAYAASGLSAGIYRIVRRKKPRTLAEGGDSKSYRIFKLAIFGLILLTVIGFIVLVIFALISQIRNLANFIDNSAPSLAFIDSISAYLQDLSSKLGGFLPESAIIRLKEELINIQNDIMDMIPAIISSVLASLFRFISNFPDMLFKLIVILMSGYYFITARLVISKFIDLLFPSKSFVDKTVGAITKVSSSLFRVLGGYMIIMAVTFIEALIGLTIIQMPYAVIIAIVVMFVDLLPMVGASACFFPISIYMFVQGKPIYGLVALAFVGIMTFMRSIMEPKIIGTAMKLHPLLTLVAMLLGVAAFGFIGFLGGPILLVLILGIADAFGFRNIFRTWSGNILNKVAHADGSKSPDLDSLTRIRHVVMWKFKDEYHGISKAELIDTAREKLEELPSKIPQILSFETGNDNKYDQSAHDLIIIADFASQEDLDIYKNHPEHVKVAKYIREVIVERSVADFGI